MALSIAACHAAEPAPSAVEKQSITTPVSFGVKTLASDLDNPWSLAFLPENGRIFIVEKSGRLKIQEHGKLIPISGEPEAFIEGESGLFDVVLDPDFVTTHQLFLSFVDGTNAANRAAVFSAKLEGNTLKNGRVIFRTPTDDIGSGHSASRLAFLPDKTLLVTRGDGFEHPEDAQNPRKGSGKIFRINRDGTVPTDNPKFSNGVAGLFSIGHRNIEGLAVDPKSGLIWSTEHGPKGGDELNIIKAGGNYGWPRATYGFHNDGNAVSNVQDGPEFIDPLLVWTPSIAPSGLAIVQGDKFPDWRGDLLVGALAGRQLRRIRVRDGIVTEQQLLLYRDIDRVREVKVGPDGNIYILTDGDYGKLLILEERR